MEELVLSKYLINYKKNGLNYLFNCKTASLIELPLNLDMNDESTYHSYQDELVDRGYLINPAKNELEKFDVTKNSSDVFNITIAITNLCNLNCGYCFVNKSESNSLNLKDMDSLITYLKKISKMYKKINVIWFGGEPLLAVDKIEYITNQVNGLSINSILDPIIVTNGYYLTDNIYEHLKRIGVKIFQITLDGNKSRHDCTRITKSNTGSYETIITNIKNLIGKDDDFEIQLRINFFKDDNLAKDIIDNSIRYLLNDRRIKIYFSPIIDFKHKQFGDYLYLQNKKYNHLANLFEDENIKYQLPKPKLRWCSAGEKNNLIIDPFCNIYLCKSQLGDKKKVIGKIKRGAIEYSNKNINEEKMECMNCNIYPICRRECKVFNLPQNDLCDKKKRSVITQVEKYIDYKLSIK